MNRVKAEIIDQSIIGRDFYYFRFMKNDTLQYNVKSMGLKEKGSKSNVGVV
ncbi:hypothetical protein [Lysinibacillus sp. FSL P2-0066]|uniref:hypothetical protein n=1 Tax=Lysinibacillus sp. FSL P2-0066 TaxID=2921720 RepID=UPI0030D94045